MKFLQPTEEQQQLIQTCYANCYRALWISEAGAWTIALKQVIFGVRVIVYRRDSFGPVVEYCVHRQYALAIELAAALKAILETEPETLTEEEVCEMMPKCKSKPINLDPCWSRIQEMANKSREEEVMKVN